VIRQESWKISTSMQRRIDTFTLVFGYRYRYKSWKAVDHICKQSAPRFRHITTPHQHLVTQFLQAGCFSWRPTNSVKALNALCKKINVKQSKCYRLFCFACIGLFYFTCVFPHLFHFTCGDRHIDTARIVCDRVYVTAGCPSVPSVCTSYRALQQRAAGLLLSAQLAGEIPRLLHGRGSRQQRRRNSTALSGKREQCHVPSRRRRLNTDLLCECL